MSIFAVHLESLHQAVGSRDEKLFRGVSQEFADRWPHDDAYWASEIAEGAPTSSTALRAVIDGGPFDKEYGHFYIAAYENICDHICASSLSNDYFSGFRSGWLDAVGKGMEQLGITTARLDDLIYMGSPALLPDSMGLQSGQWDHVTCRAGLEQWDASTPEQRAELHPEVLGAVKECVYWMDVAVGISEAASDVFGVAAFFG